MTEMLEIVSLKGFESASRTSPRAASSSGGHRQGALNRPEVLLDEPLARSTSGSAKTCRTS